MLLLKYAGLCLAAGSSIWGTVNELTDQAPDGKRRPTRAGLIAIGFTILGLRVMRILGDEVIRRRGFAGTWMTSMASFESDTYLCL
ncbi:hypothetical protein EAV90_37070 [Bradyrhizobium vignae]|nr:hypothetical protein [Bradyrhizobium vignae]RXG84472.1 hypothetical protein EAV90_37070 [Bradyrhizobium vignae]